MDFPSWGKKVHGGLTPSNSGGKTVVPAGKGNQEASPATAQGEQA